MSRGWTVGFSAWLCVASHITSPSSPNSLALSSLVLNLITFWLDADCWYCTCLENTVDLASLMIVLLLCAHQANTQISLDCFWRMTGTCRRHATLFINSLSSAVDIEHYHVDSVPIIAADSLYCRRRQCVPLAEFWFRWNAASTCVHRTNALLVFEFCDAKIACAAKSLHCLSTYSQMQLTSITDMCIQCR